MNPWMLTLTILLSVVSLIADYMIKAAVGHRFYQWLLAGAFLIWGASVYGWYYILKFERISITGVVFSVVSLIGITLMGIFCFNERLTVNEWVGFALALIATFLLGAKT